MSHPPQKDNHFNKNNQYMFRHNLKMCYQNQRDKILRNMRIEKLVKELFIIIITWKRVFFIHLIFPHKNKRNTPKDKHSDKNNQLSENHAAPPKIIICQKIVPTPPPPGDHHFKKKIIISQKISITPHMMT